MSICNLVLSTASIPGFTACLLFLLSRFFPTECIIKLVTVIPSWDTFELSMGPTDVPMIRVPRVQIDLSTLSSKWVQEVRQYGFADVYRNNGL